MEAMTKDELKDWMKVVFIIIILLTPIILWAALAYTIYHFITKYW